MQTIVWVTVPGGGGYFAGGGGGGGGYGCGQATETGDKEAAIVQTCLALNGGIGGTGNDTSGLWFQEDHFWPRLSQQIGSSLQQVEDAIWADLSARCDANPALGVDYPEQTHDIQLPNDPSGPVTLEYRVYFVPDSNTMVGSYWNIGTVFGKSRP